MWGISSYPDTVPPNQSHACPYWILPTRVLLHRRPKCSDLWLLSSGYQCPQRLDQVTIVLRQQFLGSSSGDLELVHLLVQMKNGLDQLISWSRSVLDTYDQVYVLFLSLEDLLLTRRRFAVCQYACERPLEFGF